MAEEIDIEIGGIPLHSGSHIGPYRYERPVGKGGMANVLLATDPNNRKFAIKVLKPSRFRTGKRRFLKECRILARMRHPNVINLDSYGDIFGHPYIAMEYIEGTDLHKVIRSLRDRSLSQRWSTTRRVLTDLCKGLAYIHSHGIVHRDLSRAIS